MHAGATLLPLVLDRVSYAIDGTPLVSELSVTLQAGSRTVILGPNGAGKSLTLRLCHGLLQPTSGSVRWAGAFGGEPMRRQAMVFQRPVMLRRSALANVSYGLKLAGMAKRERDDRARVMLDRVGLLALADRAARSMSGGEQQRVALARAWALQPEVLFLDEPTASLDPAAARAVEAIIRAIHEAGTKIVMTTHNLAQARRLADEILFLDRGRLIERSPAEQFFRAPTTPEATAFLREESI
jgi:tungstate transport system ATP-binding protein